MLARNLVAALLLLVVALAVGGRPSAADDASSQPYTAAELKELVGPVALYPDVVLSSVLPASTFPQDLTAASDALTKAGHEAKAGEAGVELAPSLRDYRPDLIVIDMQDAPDRGRHLGIQLRADRATRQLPIVLVGIKGEEGHKAERAIQGPTRRYALGLTAPSVLNALIAEL